MTMRSLIRSWLGITELEAQLAKVCRDGIKDEKIREEIAEAIRIVVGGFPGDPSSEARLSRQRESFEWMLAQAVSGKAAEAAAKAVEERIHSEKFIDEQVARIKSKQLS